MPSLHLGTAAIKYKFPTLAFGCCELNVAAMIFNQNGQALKKVSTDPLMYTIDAYARNGQDFVIPLNEHAERSHYYSLDFDTDNFALASNSSNEPYTIEYWYRSDDVIAWNRDDDTLLDVEEFFWDADTKTKSPNALLGSALNTVKRITPVGSFVFDKSNEEVRGLVWLEDSGNILEDSQSATVTWYDFEGAILVTAEAATYLTNKNTGPVAGVFRFRFQGLSLVPDTATVAKIEVVDASGVTHTGATGIAIYD